MTHSAEKDAAYNVGDRVDSVYGREHRGEVLRVGEFSDGRPMLSVRRDSDGFVWVGWPETVTRVIPPALTRDA